MAYPTSMSTSQNHQVIASTFQQETVASSSSITTADPDIGYLTEIDPPNKIKFLDEFDIEFEGISDDYLGILLNDAKQESWVGDAFYQDAVGNESCTSTQPVTIKTEPVEFGGSPRHYVSDESCTSTQPVTIKTEPVEFGGSPRHYVSDESGTSTQPVTIKTEPWSNIWVEGKRFTMDQLLKSSTDDAQRSRQGSGKFIYKKAIIECLTHEKKLTLQELYQKIEAQNLHLKKIRNWRNSIRHTLSIHKKIFTNIKRKGNDPGKGGYWCLSKTITTPIKPVSAPAPRKRRTEANSLVSASPDPASSLKSRQIIHYLPPKMARPDLQQRNTQQYPQQDIEKSLMDRSDSLTDLSWLPAIQPKKHRYK